MPNDDKKEQIKKLQRRVMRGGRSFLKARDKPLLPSNMQHAINDHNHRRQGVMPYGFGTGPSEYKARRSAGNAQKELVKRNIKTKADTKKLEKVRNKLRNQNLNRARKMTGDSGFSSRNKFSSEDNKRISKPEF